MHIVTTYGRWIFLALLTCSSFTGLSGHLLGTDITYQYVSPGVYQVKVRWYRDCQGLPGAAQITACYSSASCGINGIVTLYSGGNGNFLPPCPYLPPQVSSCQGGPGMGIERIEYTGTLTLPLACNDWVISYSTFPQSIISGQHFLYVSTKIDNLNYPQNSSASYITDPVFIYCLLQPAWDVFTATDADGDSLSYQYIPLLDNNGNCPPAPFQSTFQSFYPFLSSTQPAMDSTTGVFTFTPSSIYFTFISALVNEYRSGVLINTSTISQAVIVVAGCTITGLEYGSVSDLYVFPNPSGGSLSFSLPENEKLISVEAISAGGQTVRMDHQPSEQKVHTIQTEQLASGYYSLKIVTDKATHRSRFMKAK